MAALGGSAKSWLVLAIAQAITQGQPLFGLSWWPAHAGRVLYLAAEDPERRIWRRLRTLVSRDPACKSALEGRLTVYDLLGHDPYRDRCTGL